MLNMKKGFSLIILVITITVLAILGLIIVNQTSNLDESFLAIQLINNLSMIEEKAEELNDNIEFDSIQQLVGSQIIDDITIGNELYPSAENSGIWYYIEESELPRLGINGIKGDYIVNYSTGEAVSVMGVEYQGTRYYKLETLLLVIDVGDNQ